MKTYLRMPLPRNYAATLAILSCLLTPLQAQAGFVSLATAPLATAGTSLVNPNLMFIMDNSGSMDWQHMPDDASDGGSSVPFKYGYYGLRSSQCNQVYYDPNTTYLPPVDASGLPYPNATFTNAKVNGYSTAACTSTTCTNLSTSFKASTDLLSDTAGQPAYYYQYNGSQTTALQKNYNDPTNTFSTECGNSAGSTDASGKILSVAPTGSPAGVFSKVTLVGNPGYTIQFTGVGTADVTSIKANGTELLFGTATNGGFANPTADDLASSVVGQIAINSSKGGYTASHPASPTGQVILTYPATAAFTPPVITMGSGANVSYTITPSPTASSQQTNFANWYSYYRTRMLMMKTASGLGFKNLNDKYRVGYMSINTDSDFLNVAPFDSVQKGLWYGKLYGETTNGSTPLRRALANAGLYYAHKLSLGTGIVVNDPIEYSCQQNFTILSTDGFWNGNTPYQIDGTTEIGNLDGTQPRPMYDSATSVPTVTVTYTQDSYARIKGNCSGNTRILEITPRTFTCTTTIVNGIPGNESCTSPISGTPYTSGVCTRNLNLPNPNPGPRTQIGSSVGGTGSTGGSYNSLADVAMYYYQTDLRTADLKNCTGAVSPDVCPNNVARTNTDDNTRQHMTTFTLGLGASGRMVYSPSYLTDTSGDYYSVLNGTPANTAAGICRWGADGQACNWPIPGSGMIENIDDLWHAAVDGHGIYFSATSPSSLSRGISDALAAIAARKGTGASAATSTLNPVDGNNYAYVASYTTEKWIGNLESRTIDTVTGQISPSATWCVENVVSGTCAAPGIIKPETVNSSKVYYCVTAGATAGSCTGTGIFNSTTSECKVPVATSCNGTLPGMAEATGAAPENPRHIYTADSTTSATPHLLPFTYTQLQSAGLSSYFTTPYINGLTQWPDIVANGKQTTASGDNLVKYLRGQTTYDSNPSHTITDRLYRFREATMGDALESQPVFMSIPIFNYTDPGYSDFATAQASRPGTIYIGANDGMLHAFSALAEGTVPGGTERWAYIPSMVLPNLWHLADTGYAHTNYVNGSPMVGDICISACDSVSSVWRTILVGGLNGGGRGYYALDVTDPNNPSLLWEFTADPNKPAGYGDTNLGNSFGTPVITARTSSAGTPEWIVLVTSGYNNGSTVNGDGVGHLYVLDAYTGVLREDIKTSAGSPGSPSGLARISAWNDTLNSNRATWVYGGDLEGNIWRFDISVNSPTSGTSTLFANLNIGGKKQPITTPPVLGEVQGKRVIYVATGKYLESTDSGNTDQQSVYAIMDDNATVALSSPRASLVQQTLTDTGTGVRTITSNPVSFSGTNRGWFVDFPEAGERANIESFLLQGALIVASNVPSTTVCSPGGHAWMNAFNYLTGGATDSTGVASTYYSSQLVGINHFYPEGKLVIEGVTSEGDIFVDPNIKLFAPKPGFTDRRWLYRELDPLNP